MDITQLKAVMVLSEELHFGRAARRLGISQPALSQKIQRLEGEIGASIFTRSHRKVVPTDAGRAFLGPARGALSELETAIETARKAAHGQIGRLHIGFVENASLNLLPKAVMTFREACPEVDLRLSEMISSELFEKLASGRVDVAFARPVNSNPMLDTLLVHQEPYVAVLPLGHPLGQKKTVGIADLGPLPMIIASGAKSTYIRKQFAPLFAQAGYKIRVGQEINQLPAVLGLVSSGIGYALQPQSVAKLSTAGVIYRPLAIENAPNAELVAAWRTAEANPTVARFMAILKGRSIR